LKFNDDKAQRSIDARIRKLVKIMGKTSRTVSVKIKIPVRHWNYADNHSEKIFMEMECMITPSLVFALLTQIDSYY
jgi:hypothetical protein